MMSSRNLGRPAISSCPGVMCRPTRTLPAAPRRTGDVRRAATPRYDRQDRSSGQLSDEAPARGHDLRALAPAVVAAGVSVLAAGVGLAAVVALAAFVALAAVVVGGTHQAGGDTRFQLLDL